MCLCPDDSIASMCYTNCSDTYCENNGTCSTDMDGKLMCNCMDGYSGKRCEVNNTNIVSCSATVCMDLLTDNCTQVPGGSVMCHCRNGITGTYCERWNCLENVHSCSNGVCYTNDLRTDTSSCSCMAGYNGTKCEENINDCVGSVCQNNGTCVDGIVSYNCSCPTLYTGTYCEQANCEARNCSSRSANGMCDVQCMNEECNYDGLECSLGINPWSSCSVVPTTGRGIHCSVLFMDGVCDQECNTYGCLYDGFDCVNNGSAPADCFNGSHCYQSIGNGACNAECNNLECAYDGQDCLSNVTPSTETLIVTFTPTNATYGRLAEARLVAYQVSRKLRSRVFIRQNNGTDLMVYRVANSTTADIRAYFDILQPTDCTVTGQCVTDVQTAAKMIGAVVWMHLLWPSDTQQTLFRSVITCSEGYHYVNGTCSTACNAGCQSVCGMEGGTCVDCMDGYVGTSCETQCNPNCAGTCNSTQCIGGCNDGYMGNNCDQACSTGTYGADCNMTCAECANNNCNNVNGMCAQGCKNPGLTGTHCTDNCASGTYGMNCSMTCPNCLNTKCDRVTGYCIGACPMDKWGNMCDQDCTTTDCTMNCGSCTTPVTTTTAPTGASENTDKGVIAAIIIIVILIVIALIIAYMLWRRSQAGVYDLDEKKGDELPLNAAHVESGNAGEEQETPMIAMTSGHGANGVDVVSETQIQTSEKVSETKPLMEDETKPEPESERKEPEGRENSAEPDDAEEQARESREMKTASQYLPPTEKEGGPGGVYVGPKGPTLEDVEAEEVPDDQQSEDANFPVAPAELVSPPPAQQDSGTDPTTPPSPQPPPESDNPPTPPASPPPML